MSAKLKNVSFESALEELESIVNRLETGQVDLEKAIENYSRGEELKKHCENKLAEAKLKVEKVVSGSDDKVKMEPFDQN